MTELTEERVNALLDEAVAEKGPGYVYEDELGGRQHCQYVHEVVGGATTPGCLVGNVMLRAGVPVDDLFQYNEDGSDDLIANLRLDLPYSVTVLLREAQAAQDEGIPWGIAVENARGRVADLRADGLIDAAGNKVALAEEYDL